MSYDAENYLHRLRQQIRPHIKGQVSIDGVRFKDNSDRQKTISDLGSDFQWIVQGENHYDFMHKKTKAIVSIRRFLTHSQAQIKRGDFISNGAVILDDPSFEGLIEKVKLYFKEKQV